MIALDDCLPDAVLDDLAEGWVDLDEGGSEASPYCGDASGAGARKWIKDFATHWADKFAEDLHQTDWLDRGVRSIALHPLCSRVMDYG